MGAACKVCGKVLRTRYNLNIHMAVHTGAKPFVCDICQKGFQQKWNLVTHVSRIHAGHKPFVCKVCNRSFGYASHYKAHTKTHFIAQLDVPDFVKDQVLNPHPCTQCPRRFETTRLLTEHERVHTGEKPYICATCGNGFATRRRILAHVQRRCVPMDEKSNAKHRYKDPTPCEICGKTVARYSLNKHMNIHTRRRIYTCRTCGREFLEANQRAIHERTHSGQKPHTCEICNKGHTQLGNLWAHRKRHHGLKDKPRSYSSQVPQQHFDEDLSISGSNKDKTNEERHDKNDVPETAVPSLESGYDALHRQAIVFSEEASKEEVVINNGHFLGSSTVQPMEAQVLTVLQPVVFFISDPPSIIPRIENQPHDINQIEDVVVTNLNTSTIKESQKTVNQENVHLIPTHNEETESKNCDGNETINEFVQRYNRWISDRVKVDQINNGSSRDEDPLSKTEKDHDSSSDVMLNEEPCHDSENEQHNQEEGDECEKTTREEIFDRLMAEIGEEPKVKKVFCRVQNKGKTDGLIRLIRRLGKNLPPNTIVQRTEQGKYLWCCWECPKILGSRPLLQRHRLTHAPAHERPHRCHICSRTFTQAGNLQHHLLVHRKQHKFFCEVCGAGFRHKSHFTNHRNKHMGVASSSRSYGCDSCGKICNTRFHLIEHIRTHTNERPYLCRTCGSQFAASSSYARHLKRHEGKKEACLVCGKEFLDSSSRRRHQSCHKEQTVHYCSCGKTFHYRTSLLRHSRVCSSHVSNLVKTFQCQQCDKSFIDSTGLKRHGSSHDPSRRFPCDVCNTMLKTKETLSRHLLRHRLT